MLGRAKWFVAIFFVQSGLSRADRNRVSWNKQKGKEKDEAKGQYVSALLKVCLPLMRYLIADYARY